MTLRFLMMAFAAMAAVAFSTTADAARLSFFETATGVEAEFSGSMDLSSATQNGFGFVPATEALYLGSSSGGSIWSVAADSGMQRFTITSSAGLISTPSLNINATSDTTNVDFGISFTATGGNFFWKAANNNVGLSGTIFYAGQTLATLGLIDGLYTYTIDNTADFTIAVNQVAAVPVPAAGALLLASLFGLGAIRLRRNAKGQVNA